MIKEFNLQVIDATLPLLEQQEILREMIEPHLGEALRMESSAWREVLASESLQGRYLEELLAQGAQT